MIETLRERVAEWLKERENIEDCSCEGGNGNCWFHLPHEVQRKDRLESFAKMLEEDPL